jgi:integrase
MVLCMARPFKHPKTGVYYFRKVVPDDMRALVGKREVRVSLKTKNPREAAARHPEVATKVAAQWEVLRGGPEPFNLREASALAGLWYRWFVPKYEEDPGTVSAAWMEMARDLHEAGLDWSPEMEGDDPAEERSRSRGAQRQVNEYLTKYGRLEEFFKDHDIHLMDLQRPAFMEALEGEFDAAVRLLARRAKRDYRPDKRPERFPEWKPAAARPQTTKAIAEGSQTLTGILDGWWKEAQATGRKPSTHESYRNTMAAFVAFLGHDDARKVTPDDIVGFKDHRLASINPRTGKPISAKTVKDSDLSGLKTLFGWAVSNRKLTSNPVTGITIKLGKQARLRGKGFTDDEAKAILSAALRLIRGGETAGTFAAKRWVPWLAAYTGARVGELAQLRKQDVAREGGHWTIRLTPEAGTIKTNEARTVVLHPHLVELGFPAFVDTAPAGHLFLKVGKDGNVLGPLQGLKNRLGEFSRSIVSDPNVAPMHGWRHPVARPVQSEIDELKNRGGDRLARRARKASSLLRQLITGHNDHLVIRPTNPVVKLFIDASLRPTEGLGDLDYGRRDDQLVGCVHAFAQLRPGVDVRLLTHDTGPMASARMVGVAFTPVPDDWLLPPEPSDSDRRIRALEAEVARLKQAEPEFVIACVDADGQEVQKLDLEIVHYEALTAHERSTLLDRLSQYFPLATDFGSQERGERRNPMIGLNEVLRRPSEAEIKEYGEAHRRWLKNCDLTLMNLHESLQASQGLPEFSFSAGNVGTRPANDALVTFCAKGRFKIMPPASPHDRDNGDDDESEENSKPSDLPSPPSPPSGRWMSALQPLDDFMISLRFPDAAVMSRVTDNFPRQFLPKPHDPNAFYYKPKRQSWLRESGQVDKWIFCLTTATLAEDQEIR